MEFEHVRLLLQPASLAAVFVTERRSQVAVRHLDEAFNRASAHARLPAELDLNHSRH